MTIDAQLQFRISIHRIATRFANKSNTSPFNPARYQAYLCVHLLFIYKLLLGSIKLYSKIPNW